MSVPVRGRWEKMGLIFDPREWNLGEGIVGFAQGPQALVLDDRVRIYFSTRKQSANGKFMSTIRFADYTRDLKTILHLAQHDVIADGALGTFDEHGIFPMNVLSVGGEVYGYTCGWSRRQSVDIDMAIGLAISRDGGLTFARTGPGPVLTASPQEPFLVGDPFVQRFDSTFHMWYIFGTKWQREPGASVPERVYKIGHATSLDGITWVKADGCRVIDDRLGPDECQALPSVIKQGSRYHMFFCYRYATDFRSNPERGYRLGHAYSDDCRTWVRDDQSFGLAPSAIGWDSEMICYPHVFAMDAEVYLLYNGNTFGKFGFGAAKLVPEIDQ